MRGVLSFRVGTKVNFIKPEAPQAKSSAEAAITRHAGGRPRIWDWDGAINATWAAIYHGTLIPKRRSELNRCMIEWFSAKHEGRYPEESQIREKAKEIWSAYNGNR